MSFLVLISAGAAAAWVLSHFFEKLDLRASLRWGMGLGFLFTGVDHFASASTRYAPMLPDMFADKALFWIYLTGGAERAGGVGLLVPAWLYGRLGLPNLQKPAGVGLAVMLACVVVANVNVALKGQSVHGLEFGAWYYWIRPLFQPVFIAWALFCVGAWMPGTRSEVASARPGPPPAC